VKTRVITALCIIAVVVPLAYLGSWYTLVLAILFIGGGIIELLEVRPDKNWPWYFKLSAYVFSLIMLLWPMLVYWYNGGQGFPTAIIVGVPAMVIVFYLMFLFCIEITTPRIKTLDVFYIFGMTLLLCLAGQSCLATRLDYGIAALFYILIVTYVNDAFALFVGMKFGKHQLAPVISPKKTWEGAFGGIFFATIAGVGFYLIFPFGGEYLNVWLVLIISIVLAVGGIFGDLIFSSIKRHLGLKDFGNIFPGHGGFLDRIDSITFNLVLFAVIISIVTGVIFL